jgi:nitroimidazol reductase NimA-like FMN-containing flavoprotein (pyridoxamine 5'-phosphate oxidase superfamily)
MTDRLQETLCTAEAVVEGRRDGLGKTPGGHPDAELSVPRAPGRESGPNPSPTIGDPEVERLSEADCWRLISPGGVGRLAYSGRYGLAVLPVNYKLAEGSLVFRITLGSPTDEDLRTGIQGADYQVAIEIDEVGQDAREGWFVFIQGAAHHLDSDDDGTSAALPRVQSSAGGTREHFLSITPTLITGRRLPRH